MFGNNNINPLSIADSMNFSPEFLWVLMAINAVFFVEYMILLSKAIFDN
jgi:hypothetical protein